jgi:hypothetical protein
LLAAMLILWRKRFFEWQTFQPSQIPLGAWVVRKELPLLDVARSVQRSLPGLCLIFGVTQIYTAILAQACSRHEGLVYTYAFNDQPVAVNLCVQRGATLIILKTTYDETIKTFSPAFLLLQEALEPLFTEQHIRRMEFFGKVMEWHTRWTDNSRTLYHLTVFRWGGLKALRSWLQKASRWVRKFPARATAAGSPLNPQRSPETREQV